MCVQKVCNCNAYVSEKSAPLRREQLGRGYMQQRDAAMAAPRGVCMYGWGTRLLDDNLSAINDVDALESFGIDDTATLEVVDQF